MTRAMLWSLAVAAMLAMVADGAANAQQSGKRSGVRSGHTGGMNAAMGDGSVRFIRPGLGGGQRTKYQNSKAWQIIAAGKDGNARAKDASKAKGPQYNPYVTVDAPGAGSPARLQGRTGRSKGRSQNNLKQLGLPSLGY